MIWVRAHGAPESDSIFEDLLKYVTNKMIHTPHEGIGKVYAKTVVIDPVDDEFFICDEVRDRPRRYCSEQCRDVHQ